MELEYVPTVRVNEPIDEEKLYRFLRHQVVQHIGRSRARSLCVEIQGDNVLNLFVTFSGDDHIIALLPRTLFYKGWIEDYKRFTPMASHKSPIPYLVAFGLLCVAGFAIWVKSEYQYPGYDEVQQAVREANISAEYWEIQPTNSLVLHSPTVASLKMQSGGLSKRCSEVPRAKFLVSIKDQYNGSAFLFDSEKYTIDIGGDYSKIGNFDVCRVIDSRLDVKHRLLEIFRSVKVGGSIYKVPVEGVPVGDLAAELVYACIKLARSYTSCVEVLVKGYADGQDGAWQLKQEEDYFYRSASMYSTASNNGFEYHHVSTPYNFPYDGTYTNRDLPNLRAMYVQRELIDRYLSSCKLPNVTTHILEGHEFRIKSPPDRKVQVYVVLF